MVFCALFARAKNGCCLRKCRGHLARSAARTASPPQPSRANIVFLEQLSFSAALPSGRHYFSPHKMAAKNHRLSWHCRFNISISFSSRGWNSSRIELHGRRVHLLSEDTDVAWNCADIVQKSAIGSGRCPGRTNSARHCEGRKRAGRG